jgi:hypothetical protein
MRFLPGPASIRLGPAKANSDGIVSMKIAWPGACTTTLFLASALGVFAQAALAAEPNCRAIESTAARLACYDAAFPPKMKKAAKADIDSPAAYKDFIEEEGPNRRKAEEYLPRLLRSHQTAQDDGRRIKTGEGPQLVHSYQGTA